MTPAPARAWRPTADDRALLSRSGLFDPAHYQAQIGLPPGTDLLEHYLEVGWRWRLEPRPGFESRFLQPFYDAAGLSGPALLSWVMLGALGGRLPSGEEEAQIRAEQVRSSDMFDPAWYARRLPPGVDPALHYVLAGEALGWRPSERFDPAFYAERRPDVPGIGLSPLLHWVNGGHREGWRPRAAAERLAYPKVPGLDGRRVVLVLVHEASRSGAPLLGWTIAQRLADRHDVVCVLLRKGALEAEFAAVCAAVVGPLAWEEWHPVEMARLADRLIAAYRPLYAIANSIETSQMVPALASRGVPCVALVHEFAAYTRPLAKLADAFDWANNVVFPANIVAQSSFKAFPALERRRGVHVFPQGRVDPPKQEGGMAAPSRDIAAEVRPASAAFVVLGVGSVEMRKGVDVFLAVAASARRLAPELEIRFAWIGGGYDPLNDHQYSAYLAEQLDRAGLEGVVAMLPPVADLDPAYAAADLFLLSSRLDPQPNVAIDALTRALPVVCFEGASGTAEVLAHDPETRPLIAPHLDAQAAAEIIVALARDPARHAALRLAAARVAASAFDMTTYVDRVDVLGRAAADALRTEDRAMLRDSGLLDADLLLPSGVVAPGLDGLAAIALQQWAVVRTSPDQGANQHFRRPAAGFNPQAYATAHAAACVEAGEHPLPHWLRSGRPPGPWSRTVLLPRAAAAAMPIRAALHGHFHYPELARLLRDRLEANGTTVDLHLTTGSAANAAVLEAAFKTWSGPLEIAVVPNRGRDLLPFLAWLGTLGGRYDLVGHVHGKRSLGTDAAMGDRWRSFLWDTLVGPLPMLDTIAEAMTERPALGLVMAEEPHLVGWDANRGGAAALLGRMGIDTALPEFFDFPVGAMFWARPEALHKLLSLGLRAEECPEEPLPYDGTILHALERVIPLVVADAGYEVAGIRVPGTGW